MPSRTTFLAAAIWLLVAPASAQSVLDRTVGPNTSGRPVEFRALTLHQLGELAHAAGVPIGFEGIPAPPGTGSRTPIVLTGRTMGEAIAVMTDADPRYAGFDEDGVVPFRSSDAAAQAENGHPLDAPAPAVRLGETTAREALALVAALLGAPPSTPIRFSDTKPFVLDAPEGTVRSLLNAIARSHGQLVWVFERVTGRQPMFPYRLHFMSGLHGWGLGLPGQRSAEPLDLRRFARPATPPANVADVVVGTRSDGSPLVITGLWPWAVRDLAEATQVPFGMQVAPGTARGPGVTPDFTATGRTLREVLELAGAADPRYTWRVVDGMVLIRPAAAWGDSADPLFALVPAVHLEDVAMAEAVRKVLTQLGAADQAFSSFPDTKIVSLTVGQGTALDLMTALVKAHGALCWTLEAAEPEEVQKTGLRHRLTLLLPGGIGVGTLVR